MPLTQSIIKKIIETRNSKKLNDTRVRKYIMHLTGYKKSFANEIFRKLFPQQSFEKPKKNAASFKTNGDVAVAEVKGVEEVTTLESLISYCKIDTEIWEPKSFISNIWDNKLQIKADFKRKNNEITIKNMLASFEEDAAKFSPKKFDFKKPACKGKTLILNLQDLHLGKLASDKETGYGNYDINIAKEYFLSAVKDIIQNIPQNDVRKIVIISGSDLIHFDTEDTTTTRGTRLDGDSRWTKVFNEACSLITDTIEILASKYQVDVVGVYGNHARMSEYALGAYVKAFFRNHPNVYVDNQPLDRKYYGYGKTLVGFAHGDEIKLDKLPLIMMRENQATISNYEHMIFLTGHLHQDRTIEIQGIKVMIAPALCPPDKYHSSHGFVGNVQTSQGILLGDNGLEAIYYSKPAEKKK